MFDIIGVVPDPKILLCIPASADHAAVNPNGIKTLFANGLITFYTDKNLIIQWSCTQKHCIHKTFADPCKKSKTVFFASWIMNIIFVLPALSKFAIKLICWIALGSASRTCCFLNLLQSFCNDL